MNFTTLQASKQKFKCSALGKMEFLQKLKISGGVNLSNLRPSRDTERTTVNTSTTRPRMDSKEEDVSLPPRGSPAAKKMKILLVIDSPDTDW